MLYVHTIKNDTHQEGGELRGNVPVTLSIYPIFVNISSLFPYFLSAVLNVAANVYYIIDFITIFLMTQARLTCISPKVIFNLYKITSFPASRLHT